MPFIGNQPALSYTSFAKQDFTTSATTSYTLDQPVANANELALFINFVRQEPTTAYTASGTSLTLTSATSASDDMYCVFLGKAVQTVNPPNSSVGASQIVDASITSGKLASGVLPTNTPAFEAKKTSGQSLSSGVNQKVIFDLESFDTNSNYDPTTNYRFTPTIAGKYFCYLQLRLNATNTNAIQEASCSIRKNGSTVTASTTGNYPTNSFAGLTMMCYSVIDFNGSSDYIEANAIIYGSGTLSVYSGGSPYTENIFGAYKIIE